MEWVYSWRYFKNARHCEMFPVIAHLVVILISGSTVSLHGQSVTVYTVEFAHVVIRKNYIYCSVTVYTIRLADVVISSEF